MKLAMELFGNLVLTFLGFVLPIVGILLTIFTEGVSLLTKRYENEKREAEENIKKQLKKIGTKKTGSLDEKEIRNNLNELENIKKEAVSKLSYLNPQKQILRFFIPLAFAFLAVELASINFDRNISFLGLNLNLGHVFLLTSVVIFFYALWVSWTILDTIIEIKKTVDENKSKEERESKQTLYSLLKKTTKGAERLLKKIYICVEDQTINGKKIEISLSSQEKKELKISVFNSETRMAKNIEVGFRFPTDFIIEKTGKYSVYNDGDSQIVRDTIESLHGRTDLILGRLIVTPLEKGTVKVTSFIKGENVDTLYRDFIFKIS